MFDNCCYMIDRKMMRGSSLRCSWYRYYWPLSNFSNSRYRLSMCLSL